MSEAKLLQLMPSRMKLAEQEQITYFATVEAGVSRKDLLEPQFWAHVAQSLRPRYQINVCSDDDSFYATYLVIACDKTWARVHELSYHNLGAQTFSPDQLDSILKDYDVTFRGPRKWSVIRKQDRNVLQDGLHSREDAHKWLSVHLNQNQQHTAAA